MKQTAVDWLVEQLKNGKEFNENLIKQAKEMEKEQSECICVNVIERILNESEQGREINSEQIFKDVYQLTFKSE